MKKSFLKYFGSLNKLILIPGILALLLFSVTQGCNGASQSEDLGDPLASHDPDLCPPDGVHEPTCFPEGCADPCDEEGEVLGVDCDCDPEDTFCACHLTGRQEDPYQDHCSNAASRQAHCCHEDLGGKCNRCGDGIRQCCVIENFGGTDVATACCSLEPDCDTATEDCCSESTPGGCIEEQCDDGNNDDGDNCSADCEIRCVTNEDCIDDTVCNGNEICGEDDICHPGTPLICEDQNQCTDDNCDPADGCISNFDGTNICDEDAFACTDDFCKEVCTEISLDLVCTAECAHEPNNANCNDPDPCTQDTCVAVPETPGMGEDGCVHTPILSGQPTTCGTGACERTVDSCEQCVPGLPSTEGPPDDSNCEDGIDNDCDRLTDLVPGLVDPDCIPAQTEACQIEPNNQPNAQDDGCTEEEFVENPQSPDCVNPNNLVDTIRIEVLANDTDADGDVLRVTRIIEDPDNPLVGTVQITADGKAILYTPNSDVPANETWEYEVTDGKTICLPFDKALARVNNTGVAGCQLGRHARPSNEAASGLILLIGMIFLGTLRRAVRMK